jgi:hypothetical protein
MSTRTIQERLIETEVTYTLQRGDKFFIIEGVPARVNAETGEQFFAPETVEKLQQIFWEQQKPVRQISTPVYRFAP